MWTLSGSIYLFPLVTDGALSMTFLSVSDSPISVPFMDGPQNYISLVFSPISHPVFSCYWLVRLDGPWTWLLTLVVWQGGWPLSLSPVLPCSDSTVLHLPARALHCLCWGQAGLSPLESSPTRAAPWNLSSVRWDWTLTKPYWKKKKIWRAIIGIWLYLKFSASKFKSILILTTLDFRQTDFGCSGFSLEESQLLHDTSLFNSNIYPEYLDLITVFISSPSRNAEYNVFFIAFLYCLFCLVYGHAGLRMCIENNIVWFWDGVSDFTTNYSSKTVWSL